jgi:hypothetical protein
MKPLKARVDLADAAVPDRDISAALAEFLTKKYFPNFYRARE